MHDDVMEVNSFSRGFCQALSPLSGESLGLRLTLTLLPPHKHKNTTHTHTLTLTHTHTYTYAHMHTHTYMYMYSQIHYTRTHTRTHTHTQHPLWHRLLKDYQDQGLLVEGPLNNLRKNEMHLPKPSKLYNKRNPVS